MPTRSRSIDQARALLYHARAATPFCSPDGEPCASVPASLDSRRVLPLRSADFRDWLTANFFAEFQLPPSPTALRSALRTLEAQARYGELPAQKIDLPFGFEGDPFLPSRIFLDLASPSGDLLEITAHGHAAVSNFRHSFRQSPSTPPLPAPPDRAPTPETTLAALHSFAQLFSLDDTARARTFAWLTTALRPTAPYPILVLRGPAGSGKSTFARALRALIDPSTAPLRRIPSRYREFARVAPDNWLCVFDQVQRLPRKIAAALAALSTGDALDLRQPDDRSPITLALARPVILIAPTGDTDSPWSPPRTLSSRTLTLPFKPIAAPRPEAQIASEFEALRPMLFAALVNAVSTALARLRDVDIGNVPRFADSTAWACAASPALGLTEAHVIRVLTDRTAIWSSNVQQVGYDRTAV